ncbi:MAG: nuclear transport factor 2 family protein [Planctomycetes bacterium]|nr:nuclear transport factor 2 family protein [Planctomycetota bacterium]
MSRCQRSVLVVSSFVLTAFALVCVSVPGTPQANAAPSVESAKSVLRRFHFCAATADFDGYFALFHPDGVFLGTDGTERWTVAQFKEFARPHFEGESAWVFEPRVQNVTLGPEGRFAWFDEVLHSESYGECRGSGVLIRNDGDWKIGQYNLTVPIPNSLLRDVVARIRGEFPPVTRVIAVRHAEKQKDTATAKVGDDPALTELGTRRAETLAALLRDVPVDRIYATEYQRTRLTVAPTAEAKKLETQVIPARETNELARRVETDERGKTVLVAGHSNTIPALIRALGVPEVPNLSESDHDDIFVVTLSPGRAPSLLRLHVPVAP